MDNSPAIYLSDSITVEQCLLKCSSWCLQIQKLKCYIAEIWTPKFWPLYIPWIVCYFDNMSLATQLPVNLWTCHQHLCRNWCICSFCFFIIGLYTAIHLIIIQITLDPLQEPCNTWEWLLIEMCHFACNSLSCMKKLWDGGEEKLPLICMWLVLTTFVLFCFILCSVVKQAVGYELQELL